MSERQSDTADFGSYSDLEVSVTRRSKLATATCARLCEP